MKRLPLALLLLVPSLAHARQAPEAPLYRAAEIFPLQDQHVHGSTLVELPNGDLLAAWFQGSGERWADDVAIMGARLPRGADTWTRPFVLADVPDFPDINPVLFLDTRGRLWLMWYTVLANQWETSLLKYRISTDYRQSDGPPVWAWQDVLHVKPGGRTERGIQPGDPFAASVERQLADYAGYLDARGLLDDETRRARWQQYTEEVLANARGENMVRSGRVFDEAGGYEERPLGYPHFRRLGWQTRNQPVLVGERMIVPLYSDGFSFTLMALTDDGGRTWSFSEPLVGPGNIQAALARKANGTLVAYMRDNGPPPKRLHVSSSVDSGRTWSPVRDSDLPNPGAGADVITLANGHWLILYNDTEQGRHRLAAAVSPDEGRTWPWKRYLERDDRGEQATRSHYPAVVQGRDGMLHATYSYHHNDRSPAKTIKYARFNEAWVRQGDGE